MKITRFEDLDKDFRLSGQIQAAATSSMANIAEGFIRRSNKEFIQSNKTAKIISGLIKYLRTK